VPKVRTLDSRNWPIRCEPVGVNRSDRGSLDSTKTRERASEVDSTAFGDSGFRTQPGRKGQGVSRICHRAKYQCRRSFSGGAALFAKSGAGFARNPERTFIGERRASASDTHLARPGGSGKSFRGVSPARPEVRQAPAERNRETLGGSWETCFCSVKIFSYLIYTSWSLSRPRP
jgi:hypothetical protein